MRHLDSGQGGTREERSRPLCGARATARRLIRSCRRSRRAMVASTDLGPPVAPAAQDATRMMKLEINPIRR